MNPVPSTPPHRSQKNRRPRADVYPALEELAARHPSGAQVEELKALIETMDAATEEEDLDRYYALNLHIHQRLVETGATPIVRMLERFLAAGAAGPKPGASALSFTHIFSG